MLRKLGIASGCAVLLLFAASVSRSLTAIDERCDNCGETMDYAYAQPSLNSVVVVYRCRNCDQRGQREFRDDGTIHWTEW